MKTRFAKFYNLPELVNLWKLSADVQTADMLQLPVPEVQYHTVTTQPTLMQRELVAALAERADVVRRGGIDPSRDNMLRITMDGRNLALDQRMIDPALPDEPDSKIARLVENAMEVYHRTAADRGTQLIFSDLSTPGKGARFCAYDEIKAKLMAAGVPEAEIAYIHDAKTDARKRELFAQVREGRVRFLLGSTPKMGAGTNVQTRLAALHHLDVPWRPADIEQREGRIIR